MKISIISDVHLEFGGFDLSALDDNTADIMILAGDICEDRNANNVYIEKFIYHCCRRNSDVLFIPGNHEFYNGLLNRLTHIKEFEIKFSNFRILDRKASFSVDNWEFFGSTLWTNFGRSPIAEEHARARMNDYKSIGVNDNGQTRPLWPADTFNEFELDFAAITSAVIKNRRADKKMFICTHHSPSMRSVPVAYENQHMMNLAYANDLDDFVEDNSDVIKFWVHGHIHTPVDYMIGDCRVISNPFGYGISENPDWKQVILEIPTRQMRV